MAPVSDHRTDDHVGPDSIEHQRPATLGRRERRAHADLPEFTAAEPDADTAHHWGTSSLPRTTRGRSRSAVTRMRDATAVDQNQYQSPQPSLSPSDQPQNHLPSPHAIAVSTLPKPTIHQIVVVNIEEDSTGFEYPPMPEKPFTPPLRSASLGRSKSRTREPVQSEQHAPPMPVLQTMAGRPPNPARNRTPPSTRDNAIGEQPEQAPSSHLDIMSEQIAIRPSSDPPPAYSVSLEGHPAPAIPALDTKPLINVGDSVPAPLPLSEVDEPTKAIDNISKIESAPSSVLEPSIKGGGSLDDMKYLSRVTDRPDRPNSTLSEAVTNLSMASSVRDDIISRTAPTSTVNSPTVSLSSPGLTSRIMQGLRSELPIPSEKALELRSPLDIPQTSSRKHPAKVLDDVEWDKEFEGLLPDSPAAAGGPASKTSFHDAALAEIEAQLAELGLDPAVSPIVRKSASINSNNAFQPSSPRFSPNNVAEGMLAGSSSLPRPRVKNSNLSPSSPTLSASLNRPLGSSSNGVPPSPRSVVNGPRQWAPPSPALSSSASMPRSPQTPRSLPDPTAYPLPSPQTPSSMAQFGSIGRRQRRPSMPDSNPIDDISIPPSQTPSSLGHFASLGRREHSRPSPEPQYSKEPFSPPLPVISTPNGQNLRGRGGAPYTPPPPKAVPTWASDDDRYIHQQRSKSLGREAGRKDIQPAVGGTIGRRAVGFDLTPKPTVSDENDLLVIQRQLRELREREWETGGSVSLANGQVRVDPISGRMVVAEQQQQTPNTTTMGKKKGFWSSFKSVIGNPGGNGGNGGQDDMMKSILFNPGKK